MFRCIQVLAVIVSAGLTACAARYDCSGLATSGGLPVTTRDVEIPDAQRGFGMKVRVVSPDTVGATTMLVVVSPGLGAQLDDFDPLARTLAASNYVVAVLEHRASTSAHVCHTGQKPLDCWHLLQETEIHPENWDDRFADMRLAMDRLPALLGVPGDRISLVGHSLGAFTVMALGGTTYVDPRGQDRRDIRDARVASVVAMSPQGTRWLGLEDTSWDTIDRPLLLVTGDRDGPHSEEQDDPPEWRREPFAHMRGGNKLMIRLREGTHDAFTARETNPSLAALVHYAVLAFIDGTLRHRDDATALTADAVRTCSKGHATLERR